MKKITLCAFLMLSFVSFSQDWTSEQEAVIAEYHLVKNDHRGIQFVENQQDAMVSFNSLQEATEYFLRKEMMTDLLNVYIVEYPQNHQIQGAILDLRETIDLHLALSKSN